MESRLGRLDEEGSGQEQVRLGLVLSVRPFQARYSRTSEPLTDRPPSRSQIHSSLLWSCSCRTQFLYSRLSDPLSLHLTSALSSVFHGLSIHSLWTLPIYLSVLASLHCPLPSLSHVPRGRVFSSILSARPLSCHLALSPVERTFYSRCIRFIALVPSRFGNATDDRVRLPKSLGSSRASRACFHAPPLL